MSYRRALNILQISIDKAHVDSLKPPHVLSLRFQFRGLFSINIIAF